MLIVADFKPKGTSFSPFLLSSTLQPMACLTSCWQHSHTPSIQEQGWYFCMRSLLKRTTMHKYGVHTQDIYIESTFFICINAPSSSVVQALGDVKISSNTADILYKHQIHFQICMHRLTFFQLLYPLSTNILSLCKNVQRPLVIHDLWQKGKRKSQLFLSKLLFEDIMWCSVSSVTSSEDIATSLAKAEGVLSHWLQFRTETLQCCYSFMLTDTFFKLTCRVS